MAVPVIILNWNGWEDTFTCLRSLEQAADVSEVWLVDNCSHEDKGEEARACYPGLRVMRWDDNYGYAGGNNRALQIAAREGHELAYLLNNDCEVAPGFLDSVVRAASSDARLAAVGSRIAYAEPAGFVQFDGVHHRPGMQPLSQATGLKAVDAVVGAGMLVRLRVMEANGYFDERFFCYHEESEWCYRVRRQGWGVSVCGPSLVFHRNQASDIGANALYYMTRNWLLFTEIARGGRQSAEWLHALYHSVLDARGRPGDSEHWLALSAGLWDGLRGRYGRRRAAPPRFVLRAMVRAWLFRFHLHDKWQSVRGLPPGYPTSPMRRDP